MLILPFIGAAYFVVGSQQNTVLAGILTAFGGAVVYFIHEPLKNTWNELIYKPPKVHVLDPNLIDGYFKAQDEAIRRELHEDPLRDIKEGLEEIMQDYKFP